MTQEEVTEYSKNAIQAILTVYGAAKAGKWAINKVNAGAKAAGEAVDDVMTKGGNKTSYATGYDSHLIN